MFLNNEFLFFLSLFVYLGSTVLTYRLFGKTGLYVFSVFSTILCNIATCKIVDVFGFPISSGSIIYAATFLVTDILSEKHGKEDSKKAVKCSFYTMLLWVVITQFIFLYKKNASDFLGDHLDKILSISPRLFLGSAVAYILAQSFDVFMYHFIWSKTGNNSKKLWLRNNISTILSQAIDTITVYALAFTGLMPFKDLMFFIICNFSFKSLIALLDTPFLYLARSLKANTKY